MEDLSLLPEEILYRILQYTPSSSWLHVKLTCKTLLRISLDAFDFRFGHKRSRAGSQDFLYRTLYSKTTDSLNCLLDHKSLRLSIGDIGFYLAMLSKYSHLTNTRANATALMTHRSVVSLNLDFTYLVQYLGLPNHMNDEVIGVVLDTVEHEKSEEEILFCLLLRKNRDISLISRDKDPRPYPISPIGVETLRRLSANEEIDICSEKHHAFRIAAVTADLKLLGSLLDHPRTQHHLVIPIIVSHAVPHPISVEKTILETLSLHPKVDVHCQYNLILSTLFERKYMELLEKIVEQKVGVDLKMVTTMAVYYKRDEFAARVINRLGLSQEELVDVFENCKTHDISKRRSQRLFSYLEEGPPSKRSKEK